MKSILQRLKLIDHLTTEISINKKDFVEKLRQNVDHGDIGIFSSSFEPFSASKNEYKGTVTYDSFKLRRRKKMFDFNSSLAIAEGTFRQKENSLIIEATIKGFRGIFIPFVILVLMFYIGFILFSFTSESPDSMGWVALPFLVVHSTLMLGFPYFIMRRSVSRMKYELERDFYYLTK